MKTILPVIVLVFITQACNQSKEKLLIPLKGGVQFQPKCNCLYSDATKKKLEQMIKDKNPYDSLLAETRKLIASDTALLARDSLRAKVHVVVTSAVGGFGARLNGMVITTNEETIPIFPDSVCFWINCFGTQGKVEGNLFINGKKKSFAFKGYESMTDVTMKLSLKDFKEALPRRPKPVNPVPAVQKDSIVAHK